MQDCNQRNALHVRWSFVMVGACFSRVEHSNQTSATKLQQPNFSNQTSATKLQQPNFSSQLPKKHLVQEACHDCMYLRKDMSLISNIHSGDN